MVEGATPRFSALVRHRAGEMVHAKIHHLPSPVRGRSLYIDPCGKAYGRPFALMVDVCLLV